MVNRGLARNLPQIVVNDTRSALGRLAACWRRSFGRRLVAVTGSNGKTTVKEMLASILAQRGSVLATKGNLNNDIGVPLTLLRIQGEEFAVVEMGANHPGEIAYLSAIAAPDVAVLNNVGAAHLEGFGDIEGVAKAKGEILSGLAAQGTVILNADDPWASLWRGLAERRQVLSFGMEQAAEISVAPDDVEIRWRDDGFRCHFLLRTPVGECPIEMALGGTHNVLNAMAAAGAALALGADLGDIAAGLARVLPVRGRLQPRKGSGRLRVIDDTYNANPDSVAAALTLLASAPGPRWLVLGDLAELGPRAVELHERLGRTARAAGIDRLFTVGLLSAAASEGFGEGACHCATQAALLRTLRSEIAGPVWVLVKGSRASAMEQVVEGLLAEKVV